MGIVVFLILSGYMPFEGKDDHENMFLIVKGKIDFNHPQWVALNISPLAVKFIKYLLQTNPCMRPSAKKVLRHPWLNTIDPKQSIASSSQNCTTSIMGRSWKVNTTSIIYYVYICILNCHFIGFIEFSFTDESEFLFLTTRQAQQPLELIIIWVEAVWFSLSVDSLSFLVVPNCNSLE